MTTRVVIVDNTPPDTQIAGGPGGAAQVTSAIFTFTGTDNLTPPSGLEFAWRLDGGAWSAFTMEHSATLTGLAPGNYLLEVKARDLAGNEDPTPAQRSFTVARSEEHTSELQSQSNLVCRLLLEKKKKYEICQTYDDRK